MILAIILFFFINILSVSSKPAKSTSKLYFFLKKSKKVSENPIYLMNKVLPSDDGKFFHVLSGKESASQGIALKNLDGEDGITKFAINSGLLL